MSRIEFNDRPPKGENQVEKTLRLYQNGLCEGEKDKLNGQQLRHHSLLHTAAAYRDGYYAGYNNATCWEPPAWLPDGCWLHLHDDGSWVVTREEPVYTECTEWRLFLNLYSYDVKELAYFFTGDETFIPPPTHLYQVRRT